MPASEQALLGRAQQLLMTGRLAESETVAEAATKANDQSPVAWNLLGQVRHARKRWTTALAAFKKARTLLPNDPALHTSIGICHFELQQLDQASAVLHQSVALDPKAGMPHLFLGRVARARGKLKLAENELRQAVALAPKDPLAPYYLGVLLFKQSRHEEAAAVLEQCLAVSPNNPSAHLNLGLVLMRLGKREEGRRHLERFQSLTRVATRDHQKRVRVSSRLRAAREDLEAGRVESALSMMLEAKAIAPEIPAVHRFLAAIYARQGRTIKSKAAAATAGRLSRAERKQ